MNPPLQNEAMSSFLDDLIVLEADRLFLDTCRQILRNDPQYDDRKTFRVNKPSFDSSSLKFHLLEPCEPATVLKARRDPDTGKVLEIDEHHRNDNQGTAFNSMSLQRKPNSLCKGKQKLMGMTTNVPFLPGGMEQDLESVMRLTKVPETSDCQQMKYLDFSGELLSCPPGFAKGLDFESKKVEKISETDKKIAEDDDIFAMMDLIGGAPVISEEETELKAFVKKPNSEDIKQKLEHENEENRDIENTLSISVHGHMKTCSLPSEVGRASQLQYATELDSSRDVAAYGEMHLNVARTFPFDLDPFQQQAIVCLEKGQSVFIAAHTSAGKTVVAEYAIALCGMHRTRVIYTSPIKALSNQKFRDFHLLFSDVGLITGDVQLNSDAFCLIMTTEILRSMLYNGSEVVRELEWVIFDEVHYINDTERGHVWEEVLIMLPSHVKIIMLSATVPNCMEFADWVGRIKNRRINVITTMKRPVPLEHFLYTGQDGKTKNDRFLIVDKSGKFLSKSYTLATQAKSNMKKVTTGPKNYRSWNKSDKNVYISLINHLNDSNLLPVVIFVFSRKRCDENATLLTNIDLNSEKQKSEVHHFFSKYVARLKGSDRKLPQVLQMQQLCKRGLAVHHSGILPILKEMVEMLFQKGYVKVVGEMKHQGNIISCCCCYLYISV